MLPLRIAILWHQHQPFYKQDHEFLLPWVRLHGVKDYFDLLEYLHEFPEVKQTCNLVPSLLMQVDEYISGQTIDKIQRLTLIDPPQLTDDEKREIIRLFFLCNVDNMILPYPRYAELFRLAENTEWAVQNFSEGDWCDLQVWYNLTWVGQFSRERSAVKRLFSKETGFTVEEKLMLMDIHKDILNQIKPELKYLNQIGQVEISVSPMHHPILPLVCNSASALEAMPGINLPSPEYHYPQDARMQVVDAIKYYEDIFGFRPEGMWPSEGSISNEALKIMAESGLKWAASDEQVLAASQKDRYNPIEKYFPRIFKSGDKEIAVLFRDHQLSDAIGFIYSRWNGHDAANDFCYRLRNIRNDIVHNMGEEALRHAVVPVILDGENCWEFYRNNGADFLRALYSQLTNSEDLTTITCSEAVAPEHCKIFSPIENIRAGSWINANFKIWIGHPEDVAAWSMLSRARKTIEVVKEKISEESYKKAMDEILIAEGSDWFWWYGDEHVAENKYDFDKLFRWHISEVYKAIGIEIPEEVYIPISEYGLKLTLVQQTGEVHPAIDGRQTDLDEWQFAGYYDAISSMGAMHQVGEILHRFWFASGDNKLYFRFDVVHELSEEDYIEMRFFSPRRFTVILHNHSLRVVSDEQINLTELVFASKDLVELAFSRSALFSNSETPGTREQVELVLYTKSKENELIYPRQGTLNIKM